jgi:YfiR/HmsC-like
VKRAARRWLRSALLVCWLAGLMPAASPARAQSRDERSVRAAYVFNLIQYVQWPAQGQELTIGFAGEAATGDVIAPLLNGKKRDGQTIRVLLSPSENDLARCSLVYVADGAPGEARRTLEKLKGHGVLTVGETDAFVRDGGMIALVNSGDHIRIEVNLEAAQAAGIRISSRVLNLATIVRTGGKGGA